MTKGKKTKVNKKSTDFFPTRLKPIPEEELEKLAEDLIAWAALDTSITFKSFTAKRQIWYDDFLRWQERCANLKKAAQIAKMMIGVRREEKALEGKYSAALVMHSMPLYDEDYKGLAEWKAKLNQKQETSNQQQIIVIEKFPETNVVPEKKKAVEGLIE